MVIFLLRKFIKKIDSTKIASLTMALMNFRPQVSKSILGHSNGRKRLRELNDGFLGECEEERHVEI
jgi:hypothetical protein